MDVRGLLEQLEGPGKPKLAPLAYLAAQFVEIDSDELNAARRRALLLLAAGGDPSRELYPDDRAPRALAAELDSPTRRAALEAALRHLRGQAEGLPNVAQSLDDLLADGDLAWHWLACALLAEELLGDADE